MRLPKAKYPLYANPKYMGSFVIPKKISSICQEASYKEHVNGVCFVEDDLNLVNFT